MGLGTLGQIIGFVFSLIGYGILALLIAFVVVWVNKISGAPKEEEIIERWSVHLKGAAEAGKELFKLLEAEFDARKSPYDYAQVDISPTLGKPKRFLQLKFESGFSAYLGYEILGNDLFIFWALREKLSPIYLIPFWGPLFHRWFHIKYFLDFNRLHAFASFTKDTTETVALGLMQKYNLDQKRLLRPSSGKLGPL